MLRGLRGGSSSALRRHFSASRPAMASMPAVEVHSTVQSLPLTCRSQVQLSARTVTISDGSLLREAGYVDGDWVTAGSTGNSFAINDPATGDHIANVPEMGALDTAAAISAANEAMPAWRSKGCKERAGILRRWADLMMANQEDLAQLMTLECGKPLAEARGEVHAKYEPRTNWAGRLHTQLRSLNSTVRRPNAYMDRFHDCTTGSYASVLIRALAGAFFRHQ